MSLNNISLPPSLLAELYANALVQGNETIAPQKQQQVQTQAQPQQPLPFLGKNEKHILILVRQKNAAYLPDKELQFLTTVLSACGLNLSHVAIVNWALQTENTFGHLQAQLSPQKILLLDVKPEELALPTGALYAVQKHGELEFVAAPPLAEIEKTKQAKSSLWIALKQLFCL